MTKTILWHTWEPGLEENEMTSGGGAAWTKFLWKKLEENGYNIYWFDSTATHPFDKGWQPAVTIDVAVFCWRWKLPDESQYRQRNMIFERQNVLLKWCYENHVPVLIHDQDLKMTPSQRDSIISHGGVIATPSFFPDTNEISLHFPNPYNISTYFNNKIDQLVYVGNNYERLDQAVKYIHDFSAEVNTIFYGNWIEPGPGRNPEMVKSLLPHVVFGGRLPQSSILNVLGKAKGTIMLHKEEYGPRGFTTIRWAEAAASSTLPFIPNEFKLPPLYKPLLNRLRVSDSTEMLSVYKSITKQDRFTLVTILQGFVSRYMGYEQWIKQFERMTT